MPRNNIRSKKSLMKDGAPLGKPVALTVKIDGNTYVRLSSLRALRRSTHQEILRQALEEYLDGEGI